MLVYQSTKAGFIGDVESNEIDQKILQAFVQATTHQVGKSEKEAWKKSMHYMRDVLYDEQIPNDAGVSVEYHILNSAKRVDFILCGQDEAKRDHVVIVELKQWSEVKLSEKDGIVHTDFYGEQPHPSYQAWSYAALLGGFSETVEKEKIQLRPCAYLHNYIADGVIRNSFYADYIKMAPIFLEGDAEKEKLRSFIKQFVKHGDRSKIMYRIEAGNIRPSKNLADSLSKMLKGNREFVMIDDQKVVYESALALAKHSTDENKNVLIIDGGPGTGKSVVAVNLLVAMTKLQLNAQYVTKNSAPRDVYESKLKGSFRKCEISNFFTGSGSFTKTKKNVFHALIVDEAHRLNAKSGFVKNLGENQIKELIEASKFTVFFIDEDQRVTWHDIGEIAEIERWADKLGAKTQRLRLASQFRCGGSDGYMAWIDDVFQLRQTANTDLKDVLYDFQIFDSPAKLREAIFEKNKENNSARLVAGYCWDWVSRKNGALKDITFPDHQFGMKWNLKVDGNLWIQAPESVNEVGCIHTCQGLDVDYIGVIVGADFTVRNGEVFTVPSARSSHDKSLNGYKKARKADPKAADKKADTIIKNTYRTLMTRGQKGCYVYFVDKETEKYFRSRMASQANVPNTEIVPLLPPIPSQLEVTEFYPYVPQIFTDPGRKKFVSLVPLYTLEAAAGSFGEPDSADCRGWVKAPSGIKINQRHFIAKVVGKSMEPKIKDGSYCLFTFGVIGSRNGRIVLAQHSDISDPETGGSYTIKKYLSKKTTGADGDWQHTAIQLLPINPDFKPIKISADNADDIKIIAEFVTVLEP